MGTQPATSLANDQPKNSETSIANDQLKAPYPAEFPKPLAQKSSPLSPSPLNLLLQSPLQNSETSITSDKLEISLDENQSEFLFTGNVKLAAPAFSAECAVAKVITFGKPINLTSDFDSIKQISITGPLFLQQGERSCSADRAEITTTDTTIILSGNATAKDTMGTISGNEIRINYTTKSIEILGASYDKPVAVNVIAPPNNFSDKDIAKEL
ncbi:MAG: LptA/OstA family protein [Puniceicoccales bacterium]|nr:LptA/OstA family protein [Puniceicoccales bacterium]